MSKTVSGKQTVKILCRDFGFYFISQKGSHVKLAKRKGALQIVTIIPMHKELSRGTLTGVLELAQVKEGDFRSKL